MNEHKLNLISSGNYRSPFKIGQKVAWISHVSDVPLEGIIVGKATQRTWAVRYLRQSWIVDIHEDRFIT